MNGENKFIKILGARKKEKGSLQTHRHRWQDNKMNLKEKYQGFNWLRLVFISRC
jgi:hypothetical protein